jgi:hypothetical protein
MMDMEKITERLTRLETKMDIVIKNQDEHNKKHYDFSVRSFFALVSSGVAILIAIFRNL